MKLSRFVFVILVLSLASCQYDYDFGGEFTPSIVIVSTITPDSTIKASLHWSRHIDDTLSYKEVERFTAKIYEDSNIIFDGECVNGLLSTPLHPKEGSQYRLEIDVPDYGRLSAETSIPSAPKMELGYIGVVGGQYHHFNIDKIEPSTTTRSVMIRAIGLYKEREPAFPYSLYANNSFCDQFNAVGDAYDVTLRGSSVGHEDYIRVPYKNLERAMPLKFSVVSFGSYSPDYVPPIIIGYDDFGYPIYENDWIIIGYDDFGYPIYEDPKEPEESEEERCTHILIEVIAPSEDYDRFFKSAYLQDARVFSDMPLFNETVSVHSNIENGLGIFMGYSTASEKYEMKYEE